MDPNVSEELAVSILGIRVQHHHELMADAWNLKINMLL
jgi:hypothetical protein